MPQIINTNIGSLNSQRHLNSTQNALSRSLERLSSGKRINNAKDDAAGLGISSRMTSQVNGMNQAIRNARDGISMAQTAEGSLSKSEEMLQRIRTLAVQSSNATNAALDRQSLQQEVGQLLSELDRVAQTASFNGRKLLDGTMGYSSFQVGANANELISFGASNFRTHQYGAYMTANAGTEGVAGTIDRDDITTGMSDLANAVDDGAVTVRGLREATYDVLAGMSAAQVAEGINSLTEKTGVTATATTSVNFAVADTTGGDAGHYTIAIFSQGMEAASFSFTVTADTKAGYEEAISMFNEQTSKTGVSAKYDMDQGGIILTNTDGSDIKIANLNDAGSDSDSSITVAGYLADGTLTSTATLAATALTADASAATFAGTVQMSSTDSFTVSSTVAAAGLDLGQASRNAVNSIDISSFEGAQRAIQIASAGIDKLNREMANYGALQNRLQYTIENLEINSENTANARSRIMDADFAAETAELARTTILQQAGIAMLAQANQMPQNVLSLIR